MKENKGALTMTKCGEVSYALLANCQIASPEVTEKLFESMNEVGRFSRKPSDVINTVTDMVVHDMKAMQDNIGALREISPRNTISPTAPSSMGRAGRSVSIPTAVLRMMRSCAVRMMHPAAREPSSVFRYSPSRSRAVPSWHESSPRTIRLSRKTPIRVAISRHRRCSRSTSMTRRGSMGTR